MSARDRARGQTSRSRTQRAQRTISRGAQRGASGRTTHVSSANQNNQGNNNSQNNNQTSECRDITLKLPKKNGRKYGKKKKVLKLQ